MTVPTPIDRIQDQLNKIADALADPDAALHRDAWQVLAEDQEIGYRLLALADLPPTRLEERAALAAQCASFMGLSAKHLAVLDRARRRRLWVKTWSVRGAVVLAVALLIALVVLWPKKTPVPDLFEAGQTLLARALSQLSEHDPLGNLAFLSIGVILTTQWLRRHQFTERGKRLITGLFLAASGLTFGGLIVNDLLAAAKVIPDVSGRLTHVQSLAAGLALTFLAGMLISLRRLAAR